MMRSRFPKRVTKRDVLNTLEFWGGGSDMIPKRERAKPRQPEKEVMAAVKEWAGMRSDVTLWRNNVGSMEWAPGRWLRYGLCVGSADFIGLTSITITPDLVGKKVAVFTALEAKAENGVLSTDQERFLMAVKDAGGIASVVHDAEEAQLAVERWHKR